MERKGGCCLAPRYGAASAAGAGGQAAMEWQMGRIMLKFRPIAPKPAAMAPAPTPAQVAGVRAGKGKRKAVSGSGGGRRGRKPKKAATAGTLSAAHAPAPAPAPAPAAAAQTVPKVVASDCKEREKSLSSPSSSSSGMTSVDSLPPPPPSETLALLPVPLVETTRTLVAAPAELPPPPVAAAHAAGQSVVAPRAKLPAAALVTVEDVTSVWRDGGEAPSSAAARAGDDAAPAFVSDKWGRVTWMNAAFHRAVAPEAAAPDRARVALAAKDGAAAAVPAWGTCAGFTCRARVHPSSPRRGSVVAPCDVWRLDAGGCYLWRLDLQAALSLSLSLGAFP